jgi:hypothetical protein
MEQPNPDNKVIVQNRVHPKIKKLIEQEARILGMPPSEWLRWLINQELDKRGYFHPELIKESSLRHG